MSEPSTPPSGKPITTIPLEVARGEKPFIALSCSDWYAAEKELIKIDGAIRVLLHLGDADDAL